MAGGGQPWHIVTLGGWSATSEVIEHPKWFHELCAVWPALTQTHLGVYAQNSVHFPVHNQRFSCEIFEYSFGVKMVTKFGTLACSTS